MTPLLEALFGRRWPDDVAARPRLVVAATIVGAVAAMIVPSRELGLGTFVVFLAIAGVVVGADARLRSSGRLLLLGLCLLLGSVVLVRDAQWVVILCVLAAIGLASAALVDVRSLTDLGMAALVVPLAGLRCAPWLGRSMVAARLGPPGWAVVRTWLLSLALLVAFGGLFASADALFSSWAGALVPDLGVDVVAARLVVLAAVAGATLAFVYAGINPPQRTGRAAPTPTIRTFEWLLPVGIVIGVFVVFVAAQLTVMFGGHEYLARTTGITYAEYVHQGFEQLCVATVLTLAVVAAAATKARRETTRDRLLVRAALGALCALLLVVVTSALYRMHVYEQAYGFTRLRLLVSFFEGWLGVLVVLVMVAGIRLRAAWLPMGAVLSAAIGLLSLAWMNPDAYIATHNVQRYHETGKIDLPYLAGLSSDAAPALAGLRADVAACVVDPADGWLEWNLGRARARALDLGGRTCPDVILNPEH